MAYRLQSSEKTIHITGLYSFFYHEHGNSYHFPGESHNFWELVYVDRGEVSVVAEKNGYVLKQGEMVFHKPNEFHAHSSTSKEPHNIIVTSFESNSKAMHFFETKVFTLNSKQKDILSMYVKEIRNAFAPTYAENKNVTKSPIYDNSAFQIAVSHLEHLLIELMRNNNINVRNKTEEKVAHKNIETALIDSIKTYLKDNVYNNINLDNICHHYNISRTHLYETFRNGTGQSVIDFYIDLKITEAKYMIRKGNLNFTQISERLGYTSIHHFSRSFKTRTGMSPSAYAKTVK